MNPYMLLLCLLALLLVSNLWLLIRVLRPLNRLSSQIDKIAKGDLDALEQNCGGIEEIKLLRRGMASMAGHLRRNSEEKRLYHQAITDGQEAERARIAHELHDETIQSLVAIAQGIELASGFLAKDTEHASAILKLGRTQAVEAVEGLRRLIADLRPPALEELGLIPVLRMLEQGTEPKLAIKVSGVERRLDEAYELGLFRAAQEAIRNAQRHAHAQNLTIQVDYRADEIRLSIRDDGIGFELPDCIDCMVKAGHFGLVGLHERIQDLKGHVEIFSQANHGTRISISLPLKPSTQPDKVVQDPVCGAIIAPQQAYGSVHYQGQDYYFCCPVCQGAFQRNPDPYLRLSESKLESSTS